MKTAIISADHPAGLQRTRTGAAGGKVENDGELTMDNVPGTAIDNAQLTTDN